MPYFQPVPCGRADDLVAILVRAEGARYARNGVVMPEKPASTRAWLEPLGNLLGRLMHATLSLAPAPLLARVQLEGWKKIAAPNLFPFEPEHPRLLEAKRLAGSLASAGKTPAILCVFTHPPVTGEWLNLNIELTRQALWAMGRLRERPARPGLIVAVDPFALDGFGLLMEGAYAGFMGGLHLGFDRLASHRGALSRALVGGTAWTRVIFRILRRLSAPGEVGIPLGGGVPTTSRPLYSAKEYVWSLRRAARGRRPAEVLEALERDPNYRSFAASGLVGERLKRNAWRMMEAWLMAVVSGAWGDEAAVSDGGPSADRGTLTPAARSAALACARALGAADAEEQAASLERELARETPYRARLFRIVARRLAGKGVPVVLVPLSHGRPPQVRMEWGEPVAVVGARGDSIEVVESGGRRGVLPVVEFARSFVDRNLP